MDDEFNFNIDDDFSGEIKKKSNTDYKKYIKPIIKITLLIVILLALVWFFFLRYAEVTIDIINSENNRQLSSGVIYLNDKTYNLGEPLKLLPGDYDLRLNEIDAKNYFLQTSDSYITISKEESEISLKAFPLEYKKIDLELVLPEEIYENQLIKIPAKINNSNNDPITITIKGSNSLDSLNQTISLNQGLNEFEISFQNKTTKGSNLTGSIFIDGAKGLSYLEKSINLKVNPAPTLKYRNFKSINQIVAGQEFEMTLEIDNSSPINIENLNLDFENASLDIDILKSWVIEETKDLNIKSKEIGTAKIKFLIPIDISIKDEYFDIIYKNSYAEVRQKMTLNIKEPEIIVPKLIDYGKITAGSPAVNRAILLENKTNFDIEIIDYDIEITTSQPKNLISELESLFLIDFYTIPKNDNLEIISNVIIPSMLKGDIISGNIALKTNYFDIKIPFKLEILELNIKLEIANLATKYTFTYPNNNGTMSEEKSNVLKLQNKGNIDLEVNSISISPDCTNLLETNIFIGTPFVLKVNNEQEFILKQRAISNTTIQGEKTCTININYTNPITEILDTIPKIVLVA